MCTSEYFSEDTVLACDLLEQEIIRNLDLFIDNSISKLPLSIRMEEIVIWLSEIMLEPCP